MKKAALSGGFEFLLLCKYIAKNSKYEENYKQHINKYSNPFFLAFGVVDGRNAQCNTYADIFYCSQYLDSHRKF